jgi:pimeloyl-ACP methyl ester carboxylesterase
VLASTRRVVTFDNAGVGGSTGTTPNTVQQMAHDAIAFLAAMGFDQADLLGFSIGSFVAQEIALIRPGLVRSLILASSAPQGSSAAGSVHHLMLTVGRAADGMIIGSHRRLLAHLRAGNADEAALEMEKHLRGLHYMWRLTRCSA